MPLLSIWTRNSHLFSTFHVSLELCSKAFYWWNMSNFMHKEFIINILSWELMVGSGFKRDVWNCLFFNIVWTIWYEKNQAKFHDQKFKHDRVLQDMKTRLGNWIKYFFHGYPESPLMGNDKLEVALDWRTSKRMHKLKPPSYWLISYQIPLVFNNPPSTTYDNHIVDPDHNHR